MSEFLDTTFQDGENREWTLRVTGKEMRQVLEELGIDLCSAGDDPVTFFRSVPTSKAIGIVWVLVRDSASAKGVSAESFLDSIYGQSLHDLSKAFHNAILNFSQPREALAPARQVMDRGAKLVQTRLKDLGETINKMTDEQFSAFLKDPDDVIKSFTK